MIDHCRSLPRALTYLLSLIVLHVLVLALIAVVIRQHKTCRGQGVYLHFMDNPSVIANLKGETNESEITSTIAN